MIKKIVKPKELVSKEKIKERVKILGAQIAKDFEGKNFTMICVMKGCIPFVADLIRNISIPFKIDIIHASSYVDTESTGNVKIHSEPVIDIKDQSVLVIDDILDTGRTMKKITSCFFENGAKDVKICVLLDKPSRRIEKKVYADYVGFEIPNAFVVGYGLDYNEYYRNLPYIGTLEDADIE